MVMTDTNNKSLTPEQEKVLGRLLLDVFSGEIKESTRNEACLLDNDQIPAPLNHIVSWIQGSSQDNQDLALSMIKELDIICDEVLAESI